MQFKDYYEVLGVPPGADADVIKSSYRRLARKFHPDVSKEKDAEERFKAINEAYEVLKDGKKRAAYDQLRARGYRPGEEFRPPPDFNREHDFDGGDAGGFSDFFESLFGRARGGATPGAAGVRRARDMRARLEIDLERAFAGGTERVQVGGKTLDVRIPAGIQPGRQIRLAGQASAGGDLLLEVHYKPNARFKVSARDVSSAVAITPWEAALGAAVAVPTLGGVVEIKVPAGSASGKRMRLKGRGLPGTPPGDQMVELVIATPPAPDAEAREFYEQMAQTFKDFDPRR